ncbi:hypothetical protein RHGRI_024548 [Rhododendron griersonianum]|nr:hypothetical protein RHGRI_024548 [Rhododendron griersonianum]
MRVSCEFCPCSRPFSRNRNKQSDHLEVRERKPANNSHVVDVKIVDQSLQPTILSLWHQFSEYEAPAMASLKGNFPVVIGLRLKTSTYYGLTLTTQVTSGFVFNAQTPDTMALQSWCAANAAKIRELPPMAAMQRLLITAGTSSSSAPVKIINLPSSVEKAQLINIEGTVKVTDFNQQFYYLACSMCNKASNAYQDTDLWCNYCAVKVPPLIRYDF